MVIATEKIVFPQNAALKAASNRVLIFRWRSGSVEHHTLRNAMHCISIRKIDIRRVLRRIIFDDALEKATQSDMNRLSEYVHRRHARQVQGSGVTTDDLAIESLTRALKWRRRHPQSEPTDIKPWFDKILRTVVVEAWRSYDRSARPYREYTRSHDGLSRGGKSSESAPTDAVGTPRLSRRQKRLPLWVHGSVVEPTIEITLDVVRKEALKAGSEILAFLEQTLTEQQIGSSRDCLDNAQRALGLTPRQVVRNKRILIDQFTQVSDRKDAQPDPDEDD